MKPRQKITLRVLQFIFYPVAVIMAFGFVWDFLRLTGTPRIEDLSLSPAGSGFDPVLLVTALLFWAVFLALLIEFLGREIFRLRSRDAIGAVVLEIGTTGNAVRFIPPLAALIVMIGFNLVVFGQAWLAIDIGRASLAEHLLFWLFYGVAHFLFVAFLLRAMRNRPFFVLTSNGFLYKPGDVSPGLIRWDDVAEIREVQLLSGSTTYSGPSLSAALAVGLKDPDKYSRRYTPLLRMLNWLLTKGIRYQTEGPGDIVLAAADFGERYGEVKTMMMDSVHARRDGR